MRTTRSARQFLLFLTLAVTLFSQSATSRAQSSSQPTANSAPEPDFPKTEEIQLVVTQAERAFEQYKQSVVMEASLPAAKQNPQMIDKDRELVEMSTKIIVALKQKPVAFHGLGGLLLLSSLDDASRNAALCSSSANSDILQGLLTSPDQKSADQILHIVQSCVNVSGYLYTVSESVQALLVREMIGQQSLNQRALETADKCNALVKGNSPVASTRPTPGNCDSAIETHIDGDFNGWDDEVIYKMDNGQIWQQATYHYHYHYAYRPSVVIYNGQHGSCHIKVNDDDDEGVDVVKIK